MTKCYLFCLSFSASSSSEMRAKNNWKENRNQNPSFAVFERKEDIRMAENVRPVSERGVLQFESIFQWAL